MKRTLLGLLLVGLLLLAVPALRALVHSDETRIRKLLASIAADASSPLNGRGLSDVAAANRVADLFTPDFQINVDMPGAADLAITDRSELVQTILAARSRHRGLKVELLDPQIRIEPGKGSAVADATGKASLPGEREPYVAEVRIGLVKVDGRWRVQKVQNVNTFE